jgi:hypothetical protein
LTVALNKYWTARLNRCSIFFAHFYFIFIITFFFFFFWNSFSKSLGHERRRAFFERNEKLKINETERSKFGKWHEQKTKMIVKFIPLFICYLLMVFLRVSTWSSFTSVWKHCSCIYIVRKYFQSQPKKLWILLLICRSPISIIWDQVHSKKPKFNSFLFFNRDFFRLIWVSK